MHIALMLSRTRRRLARVRAPCAAARTGFGAYAAAMVAAGAAEASAATDTLTAYRNTHRYGSSGGPGEYEFAIKAHGAYPPDWVEAAIGVERAYDHIGAVASFELACAVEDLQERYGWIGREWSTAGRSGGWLLLTDDDHPVDRYEDALWRLDAARRDGDATELRAAVYEYRAAVDTLTVRARALRAIEQELRAGVWDFERYVASRACWEGIVARRRRRPLLRRWRAGERPLAWRRT